MHNNAGLHPAGLPPVDVTVDIPGSLQLAASRVRGWIRTCHLALGLAVAVASSVLWLQTSGRTYSALPVTPLSACLLFVALRTTRRERAAAQCALACVVLCNAEALYCNAWSLSVEKVVDQTRLQGGATSLCIAAAYFISGIGNQ